MKADQCLSGGQTGTLAASDEVAFPLSKQAVIYLRVSTSRQATKNGEEEGYSIPAQRAACIRKAEDLGASVVAEFVDAGASARSADRAGLQELLRYLETGDSDGTGCGIDYVLVHKLDRLARDRADDVAIMLAIRKAGATLVSTSEQIDETPSGMLMHGIMASMAEFYSRNLANEAKKGIAQKAKGGGTHGFAPVGYHNTLNRIDGRDVKGVAIDEERAPHIRWAFETYATGEWSISQLRDALEERGFRSRATRVWTGKPPSNAQVHRILTNPYYAGRIVHKGVLFDGMHEPLVDEVTWFKVQEVLAKRKVAGERSWRHTHYLKGLLVCGRCGGRMGYGHAHGRGGVYSYFFCLGRHTGRTDCDLPYIAADKVEAAVAERWATKVQFEPETIQAVRQLCLDEFDQMQERDRVLLANQRQRLVKLRRQKDKLIDAYLDDAIPKEDMKLRQAGILAEIADAERLIAASEQDMELVREQLELVLRLLENADQLYKAASSGERKSLNQAVFDYIKVDLVGDDGPNARKLAASCELATELAEPVAGVAALAQMAEESPKARHTAPQPATSAKNRGGCGRPEKRKGTPSHLSLVGGSNVIHVAEREGFEPS
jgi:site-specific DNA recombinase